MSVAERHKCIFLYRYCCEGRYSVYGKVREKSGNLIMTGEWPLCTLKHLQKCFANVLQHFCKCFSVKHLKAFLEVVTCKNILQHFSNFYFTLYHNGLNASPRNGFLRLLPAMAPTHISSSRVHSDKIPTAAHMFSGSSVLVVVLPISWDQILTSTAHKNVELPEVLITLLVLPIHQCRLKVAGGPGPHFGWAPPPRATFSNNLPSLPVQLLSLTRSHPPFFSLPFPPLSLSGLPPFPVSLPSFLSPFLPLPIP